MRTHQVEAMNESGTFGSSGKTYRVWHFDPYISAHSYKRNPIKLSLKLFQIIDMYAYSMAT